MKKKRTTFFVGLFSLVAILLLVGILYFLGSTSLFSKGDRYILYFNESVHGLNIGSPVKLRGVPIGSVNQILIDGRQDPTSHLIPVIVEILPDRLRGIDGRMLDLSDPVVMEKQIHNGLRGKLQQQSFITGQIYIELDYAPQGGRLGVPRMRHYGDREIAEIPTIPSTLAQISEVLIDLRENLEEIDFRVIGDSIMSLLDNLNTNLSGDRIGQAFGEAGDLMVEVRSILQREEFQVFLDDLETTMKSVRSIAGKVDDGIEPLSQELEGFIVTVKNVLERFDHVLQDVGQVAQPESEMRLGLSVTLDSVNRAAAALSRLLEYLERNPDALVKGRPE